MLAPIQMRTELHSIRRHLTQLAQTEHLKPARVRQHRPLPAHKPMHSTHPPHQLMPGSQIQMVSIRQDDLRSLTPSANLLQQTLWDRLHRSRRSHRHKHRRLHHSMRQRQPTPAAATLRRRMNLK